MACFSPIPAYQTSDGSVFFWEHGDVVKRLELPCGKCVGCRLERSRQWSVRIMHEASLYEQNCFITLTYDTEHIPTSGSLNYRDFQLFMKRMRKHFAPANIRFFMCGEYGSTRKRPHFHACLFNVSFTDLVPVGKSTGSNYIYQSALLDRLWSLGFASVGELTHQSAAYVARYVFKKQGSADMVDTDTGEIFVPEFCHMSLKPGIGYEWFKKFQSDVFPHDHVIVNSKPSRPPKYYDRKFAELDPIAFEAIQHEREIRGIKNRPDNTDARLKVRETVALARLNQLKRNLK